MSSTVRRIVDKALAAKRGGASSEVAFGQAVRAVGGAPGSTRFAAEVFVRACSRLDRRGRILPARDARGRFRSAVAS